MILKSKVFLVLAICVIALLPNGAFAILFSQQGTLSLSFTALANGSVSSTVVGSGAYAVAAPSGLTGATWGGGCSGASTVSGFSASGGVWSATFTTPSASGTACTLSVTGTGANTASATSPGVTISSSGGPVITSITSSCSGTVTFTTPTTNCVYSVNFNTTVYVGGSWHPRLNLATTPVSGIAYLCDDTDAVRTLQTYAQQCGGHGSGSGSSTLYFFHTVLGGQAASPVVTTSAAVNLNGSTIQDSSNVDADLTAANSVSFSGLTYAPGNAYCVTPSGGNDSSSGLCGSAAFATLTKCQTAMQGGSNKTCFLESGTFSGLSTCNFTTNVSSTGTAYICLTSSDNYEIWAGYPGQNSPVIDGGSSSSTNGTFVAFYSSGATGIIRQGLTLDHFSWGGIYDLQPTNFLIEDNIAENIYNLYPSGGCVEPYNYWGSYVVKHNYCHDLQGFGISANNGQTGVGGFAMTKAYDNNKVGNSCTGLGDCGAIYGGWFPYGSTVSMAASGYLSYITDNYVQTAGTYNSGSRCIYLDDYDSGEFIKGNLCTGLFTVGIFVHNGSYNTATNNIIDITQMLAGSYNPSAFYLEYSTSCAQGYYCGTATNNSFNTNILYNGAGTAPPQYAVGFYYDTSPPLLSPPTLGTNWYATATGSFTNPWYWSNGTINDTGGVLVTAGTLFANPTAMTPVGFQLNNGTAPLAGGFGQLTLAQGPR